MESRQTVVIGAGPAGLAAAYTLAKRNTPVTVLEASPTVGGLSRTIEMFGQKVDLGPHRFFSSDPVVNDLWAEVIESEYSLVNRLTRILYKNKLYNYPLQPLNVLRNFGPIETALALWSYARAQWDDRPVPRTFEGWVTKRFGHRLFNAFFKTYTEKVWGIPCSNIDSDWAAQRIKGFSLWEAVRHAVGFRSHAKHKTLVDQFAYPHGGTGTVYHRLVERIRQQGGAVHLRSPVVKVEMSARHTIGSVTTHAGQTFPCSHLVSSMPLTILVQSLPDVPDDVLSACDKLMFRNTILVYLEVDADRTFDDQWLYVHAPNVQVGRITNFRNWCPSLYGDSRSTVLCMEYWCYDHDDLWRSSDDQLVDLGRRELKKLALPNCSSVRNGASVKLRRSYPVYRRGYAEPLGVIQRYLDTIENLYPVGRYGAFKYNNQDHSLLMGILAAEQILDGANHDLWGVNCDTTYQESARLSQLRIMRDPGPNVDSTRRAA